MRRLLLVSSSCVAESDYLDHCEEQVRSLFAGVDVVLFVPFALHDRDAYAEKARARFARMGLGLESIHVAPDPIAAVRQARGFFVGGGNTFRLLDELDRLGLLEAIRSRVLEDSVPYMGTSAGTNVACRTIETTNDMPIRWPRSPEALGLVPFNVNPHYVDPNPDSRHRGETREQRIAEFHEEHDAPVVGLREGAMLVVEGDRMRLEGVAGARLFRRGRAPEEFAPGDALDFLLAEQGEA